MGPLWMESLVVGPSSVRIWSWSSRMGRRARGEGKETTLVVGSLRVAGCVRRRCASEETRPVLRAPSGRDRTGQTKRLLGGSFEAMD